jgi:hypothetical protein
MAHTSFHAFSTASPRGGCSTGSRFAMAGRILYRNFNNIRVRSFILTGAPRPPDANSKWIKKGGSVSGEAVSEESHATVHAARCQSTR